MTRFDGHEVEANVLIWTHICKHTYAHIMRQHNALLQNAHIKTRQDEIKLLNSVLFQRVEKILSNVGGMSSKKCAFTQLLIFVIVER